MTPRRFWAIFLARNKEYFRDRAALGWNFLFPFLIIAGFSIIFQRGGHAEYKIGLIPPENAGHIREADVPPGLRELKVLRLVDIPDREAGFEKLGNHRLDLIMEKGTRPFRYWINDRSPKGVIAENVVIASLFPDEERKGRVIRETVQGDQIGYVEWLLPGILAMNMMFSGVYGVGFVIVRYRKNGVLRRLKATPLTAFEYLSAQVASRMLLVLVTGVCVYAVCAALIGFRCKGSHVDLLLFFTLGSASIVSLGLVVAARIASEELAEGVLNMITWPMMLLSEVWFSLEGSPEWVRGFSRIFPLTHVTEGMRRIMNEGAGIGELGFQTGALMSATLVFMLIGSLLFRWTND